MRKQDHIFGNIFFIAQQWQTLADKELLERTGITTKQWMLLVLLVKHFAKSNPTITEASEVYGTSRQNLKRIAKELEQKGFINIDVDVNDKRIQRLFLTNKHVGVFEGEDNEVWQKQFINQYFEGLNESQLNNFSTYIQQLVDNINKSK